MKKIVFAFVFVLAILAVVGCSPSGAAPVAFITATPGSSVAVVPTNMPAQAGLNVAQIAGTQMAATAQAATAIPTVSQADVDAFIATQKAMTATVVPTVVPSPTAMPTSTQVPATATLGVTSTLAAPAATAAPVISWIPIQLSNWVQPVGDGSQLVMASLNAVKDGTYDSVPALPAGPQPDGTDAGFCKPGQPRCTVHLLNAKIEIPASMQGTSVVFMDIPWRIKMVNQSTTEDLMVHVVLTFNKLPLEPNETLMGDYKAQFKGMDGGIFVATEFGTNPVSFLNLNGTEYMVGHSCWNCLADTVNSQSLTPVNLADPRLSRIGTPSPNSASSLIPGMMISIPKPDQQPSWIFDAVIRVTKGSTVILWAGVDDIPDATPTPTPTVVPTTAG